MLNETQNYSAEFAAIMAAMMGLAGGAVSLCIGFHEEGFTVAASQGAALAGVATSGMFGRGGRHGWIWAMFGAILATFIGASLGAAILEGAFAAIPLGPMLVIPAVLDNPVTFAIWAIAMHLIHAGAARFRGLG